jgi:putrescine aminotransferase
MNAEAFYGDVFDKYARHLNPSLAKLMGFAGFGVEVWAEGCILRDHEGREFIDCLGGYGTFTFGHRHPEIVQAVKDQLDHIALSGKAFFSANAANLAAQLAEIAPGDLQYAFFSNSGTEAVEAALKMAKAVTGRSKIVSTEGSYHGKTIGALSTTGREKYRKRFEPLMPGVSFVPYGDSEAAANQIDGTTAAMIVEPIQGEGGIILPPDGYLASLRESCDRHGALLIFDEVQSGLGRAGSLFACNHEGIAPDLMTLAKALGGGIMPIGATLGTPAIFESMFSENPLAHTSTFGGNPLACAAAIKALEILQRDDYSEKSRARGHQMKQGFKQIQVRYPEIVAEVRGRGLMIGLEFAMDEVGELVVAQLLKRGVCVAYALNNPRVLRFEPPLVITEEQVERVIIAVDESLAETAELLAMIA